jgi:hypothetical protein
MPVAPKWQAVAFGLRPSSLAPFEPMNLLVLGDSKRRVVPAH